MTVIIRVQDLLVTDFNDLRNYLSYNGYKSDFCQGLLEVPEEEYFEVRSILNDRLFEHEVVALRTDIGEFSVRE